MAVVDAGAVLAFCRELGVPCDVIEMGLQAHGTTTGTAIHPDYGQGARETMAHESLGFREKAAVKLRSTATPLDYGKSR